MTCPNCPCRTAEDMLDPCDCPCHEVSQSDVAREWDADLCDDD